MQFRDWTWYHLLPYENCLPFRGFTLFAEQGYNPIVPYSLTVVNRNITERDETIKYEVWVLTEKGHIAYQWTQYFCDSREVALQKVEEWLGKAEKIEVIAE